MKKIKKSPTAPARDPQIGSAQRRIVDILKKRPASTTATLGKILEVTNAAIRLQLNELEEMGLVQQKLQATTGRGRPSSAWSLTDQAVELFPDRHSDLTVELIRSIRDALGEEALTKVLEKRDTHQLEQLNSTTPENADVSQKLKILAKVRSSMGYMAEVRKKGSSWLITEHHCPVCAAAQECQGLCRNELKLFQEYIGEDAIVQRTRHLLSGDTRCVYQIKLLSPD